MSARGEKMAKRSLGLRPIGPAVVSLVFVALGLLYSVKTPVFETLGEPWHYRYVRRLADGQGLPPILVSKERWEQGESHQPPFYYALGALLTSGIWAGPESDYERNPFAVLPPSADLNRARVVGNKNAVLHLGSEEYPFRGTALAVRVLRWFSVLCSALTLLLIYHIILQIVPKQRVFALGAMALAAFNPQFIFTSARASNDALAILLGTLALYTSLRVCYGKTHPYRTPILMGLVVGLAALTHVSGLTTAILAPCAYACITAATSRFSRLRLWPDLIRPVLIVGGVALAVSAWWYVRNAVLYQDPLGMRAIQVVMDSRQQPLSLQEALAIIVNSMSSYWGVFGWMNVLADEVFYTLVRIIWVLGALGLVIFLVRIYWRRKTLRGHRWFGVGLLSVWSLLMLLVTLHWMFFTDNPRISIIFMAISSFSFFLFVGLTAWVPENYIGVLGALFAVALGVVSGIVPFRYIAPAYARPARITLEQVPPSMQDLDVYVGDQMFLLGYELREDGAQVGQDLNVRLYWLATRAMRRDYAFRVSLLGRQGEVIGKVDTYPGDGNYPTRLWLPGEVVSDDYTLSIAREALVPTAGLVRVEVYTWPDRKHLPLTDTQGRDLGHDVEVARVRIVPSKEVPYQPQQSLQANFADRIMFIGYDLYPRTPSAGDSWEIVLHWKAQARVFQDYTVFIHLIDSAGKKVAQLDEQPLGGDYPTHFWQTGESIRDAHRLQLPAHLPTGDYHLEMGFYLLENGERLPIIGSEATYVTLGPAYIKGK